MVIFNSYGLVGGLDHFLFFHILGMVIPMTNISQRGRYTTNQLWVSHYQRVTELVHQKPPGGWSRRDLGSLCTTEPSARGEVGRDAE